MIRNYFEQIGNFFFKYRSYIPILACFLFFLGLLGFKYPHNEHSYDLLWELLCLSISFGGLALRFYVVSHVPKGTSGRNSKKQKANSLNTTGMYSLIRHPLYLANFIIWVGISLFLHQLWFSIVFMSIFIIFYVPIIYVEETFLKNKFGDEYIKWQQRTPLFYLKIKNWESPTMDFSLKTGVRKEYHTFFAIIVTYMLMEIIGDFKISGKIEFDVLWLIFFSISLAVYLTVRLLVKKTTLLKKMGR